MQPPKSMLGFLFSFFLVLEFNFVQSLVRGAHFLANLSLFLIKTFVNILIHIHTPYILIRIPICYTVSAYKACSDLIVSADALTKWYRFSVISNLEYSLLLMCMPQLHRAVPVKHLIAYFIFDLSATGIR